MTIWPLLALAGLVSLGLRSGFVLTVGDRPLPPWLARMGRVLSPAMLGALIGASVSPVADGGVDPTVPLVCLVGGVVAVRTGSTTVALLAALGAHLVLRVVGL